MMIIYYQLVLSQTNRVHSNLLMHVILAQVYRTRIIIVDLAMSYVKLFENYRITLEQPSNLLARAQVWSKYKHQSTVKFLIGITPQGTLSFLSKSYGGCISDEELFEQSGFIDHLLPGMILMFIATY